MTRAEAIEEIERVNDNMLKMEQDVKKLRKRLIAALRAIEVADAEDLLDRKADAEERDAKR